MIKPKNPLQIEQGIALFKSGRGLTEIKDAIGLDPDTLRYHLKKLGLLGANKTHKFSKQDINRIVELRLKGVTAAELSRQFGVAKSAISYVLKKHGVATTDKPAHKVTDQETEAIVLMRRQGQKIEDIAAKLSMEANTVRYVVGLHGIVLTSEMRGANRAEYTEQEVAEIVRLRKEGLDRNLIAQQTGANIATVKNVIKKHAIVLPKEIVQRNVNKGKEVKLSGRLVRKFGVATIDEVMQKMAERRGGRWIGPYTNSGQTARWECQKGHVFDVRPNSVQQGQWCARCAHVGPSVGQLELFEYVKSLLPGVDVVLEAKGVIGAKRIDVYVPSLKVAIEYDGLLYHSEYFGADLDRHVERFRLCQQAGIKLFAIYSDEWINKNELVKAMVASRLGCSPGERLNARDLELRRLDKNEMFEDFFETNHLDGHAQSSFAYGLFSEDRLVCCGSVRTNFMKEVELARFATDHNFIVRGGAGRIVAAITDEIAEPLVSYSNNRLGGGDLYRSLGFEKLRDNRPSYWYTDGNVRLWRFKCRRRNEPDILAQYPTELAQAAGGVFSRMYLGHDRPLYRIFDYGHQKWISRNPDIA